MTGLNYSPFDPEQRLVVTDHEGAVVPIGNEIRPSPGTATVRPGGFGFEPGLWSPIHKRADSVSSTLRSNSRGVEAPDTRNAHDVLRQSGYLPPCARIRLRTETNS